MLGNSLTVWGMSRRSPIGVGDDGFVGAPRTWALAFAGKMEVGVGRLAGLFQRKAERFGVVGDRRWCVTDGRFFASLKNDIVGAHDDIGELRIVDVRQFVDGLGYVAEIPDRGRG